MVTQSSESPRQMALVMLLILRRCVGRTLDIDPKRMEMKQLSARHQHTCHTRRGPYAEGRTSTRGSTPCTQTEKLVWGRTTRLREMTPFRSDEWHWAIPKYESLNNNCKETNMRDQGLTPLLSVGVPSSSSQSSLPSVKIGTGTFSPGDVFVESLLPRVRFSPPPSSTTSSKAKASQQSKTSPLGSSSQNGKDVNLVDVLPLCEHPVIRRAQDECATLLNGNDVSIHEDEDVKEDVVQVTGRDAELVFQCRNVCRYLVFFIKDMEHFLEINLDVLDEKQTYRSIKITNARSLAKIESTRCQLPMLMGEAPGWRYVCLDLLDLTRRAFGTKHVTTTRLRLAGHFRLLKVFFQDEKYSDAELPAHLTFLG